MNVFNAGRSVLAALAVAVGSIAGVPTAQSTSDLLSSAVADWEPLPGPGGEANALFAPRSGALFATTSAGLFRSDDGGQAWAAVPVPWSGESSWFVVDPVDHRRIYGQGDDGLYRTDDDAATWSRILSIDRSAAEGGEKLNAFAPSAADQDLLYVEMGGPPYQKMHWLLRSRDGGATWEELERRGGYQSMAAWADSLLEAHPTDATRLFRASGSTTGGVFDFDLQQSVDQGTTWSAVLEKSTIYPGYLVGGRGPSPAHFYLAGNLNYRIGGSAVFTSTDNGVSWRRVLDERGGGAFEKRDSSTLVGGLAYDPGAPDRVYVGVNRFVGDRGPRTGSAVMTSGDGGTTWVDLGQTDIGKINNLVLGVDGQNLYAATDQGVWRFRLP